MIDLQGHNVSHGGGGDMGVGSIREQGGSEKQPSRQPKGKGKRSNGSKRAKK